MAGHVQQLGQQIAHDAGDLGRRGQGEVAPAAVVFGDVRAILDRDGGLAVEAEARAAAVSTRTMRAWAWSLRRNAACRAPGVTRSSANAPWPVSRRGSSTRLIRAPIDLGRRSR